MEGYREVGPFTFYTFIDSYPECLCEKAHGGFLWYRKCVLYAYTSEPANEPIKYFIMSAERPDERYRKSVATTTPITMPFDPIDYGFTKDDYIGGYKTPIDINQETFLYLQLTGGGGAFDAHLRCKTAGVKKNWYGKVTDVEGAIYIPNSVENEYELFNLYKALTGTNLHRRSKSE